MNGKSEMTLVQQLSSGRATPSATSESKIMPFPSSPALRRRRTAPSPSKYTLVGDLVLVAAYIAILVGAWIAITSTAHWERGASATLLLSVQAVVLAPLFLYARDRHRDLREVSKKWPLLATVSAFAAGLALASTGGFGAILTASLAAALGGLIAAGAATVVLLHVDHSGLFALSLRRRIAVYGASVEAERLMSALGQSTSQVHFMGLFEDRQERDRVEAQSQPISGRLDDLVELIRRHLIDEVVIALPRAASKRIAEITDRLSQYPIDVYVSTQSADDFPLEAISELSALEGAGLLQFHRKPIDSWGEMIKGLLDRALAFLLLICLSPIFLIIALAIRHDSSGPVFFRQRRHGLMNETIMVWKFRTMRVMDDGPRIVQASKDDPRITKIGALLRQTSLDELPQLINILLGEMSLVGPRPHAVAHNEFYAEVIATYGRRQQVKPGLTGWAQINGYRGETATTELMAKRIEHDLWYIRHWSLWLDMKIILLTPFYGFINKNAY